VTQAARILVIDDDPASRGLMEQILAEDGHQVTVASDGAEALRVLGEERSRGGDGFDAVVSDIRMVEADGLQVLDWVVKNAVETPVLLVTAFGNVDGAVDAIRRGAYDYISKPYDVNAIKLVVERALRHRRLSTENRRLKREMRDKYALQNVVGRSDTMLQVYKTAARVALTDATVLVVGRSGTGRAGRPGDPRRVAEIARTIHRGGLRGDRQVLESELFGHARGSFTGAIGTRRGLFQEASFGTLFLDEIGDIGPRIQDSSCACSGGEIRRVGESWRWWTRVVAASNGFRDRGEGGPLPRGPFLSPERRHHPSAVAAGGSRACRSSRTSSP
jgi:DNA-binding NtrC family response regulator